MDGPMTKFYVDNWITALRGSVVRWVFGTHERIIVFGSEHGEYSSMINFRFIEYISESSRPYSRRFIFTGSWSATHVLLSFVSSELPRGLGAYVSPYLYSAINVQCSYEKTK